MNMSTGFRYFPTSNYNRKNDGKLLSLFLCLKFFFCFVVELTPAQRENSDSGKIRNRVVCVCWSFCLLGMRMTGIRLSPILLPAPTTNRWEVRSWKKQAVNKTYPTRVPSSYEAHLFLFLLFWCV